MTTREPDRLLRVRQALAALGVDPAELLAADAGPIEPMPTVREFLPRVRAAATPAMLRAYGSYWSRADEAWGQRQLDEIRPSDILALMRHLQQGARHRGARRDGRHAARHGLHALRAFYTLAVADGLLDAPDNPAARVPLPRRLPSTRRALTGRELAAINQVVATSGRDTVLDCLLMRLHTETACRRGGALDAYDVTGAPFGITTRWRLHRAAGTYPEGFAADMRPQATSLLLLAEQQLTNVDRHFGGDTDAERVAFEEFGQGIHFDSRRTARDKVHKMDRRPDGSTSGYHNWRAFIQAASLVGADTDRWRGIDRHVGLAWAIQTEAMPREDMTDNPRLPETRLRALRDVWLRMSIAQLDAAFDHTPFPPPELVDPSLRVPEA